MIFQVLPVDNAHPYFSLIWAKTCALDAAKYGRCNTRGHLPYGVRAVGFGPGRAVFYDVFEKFRRIRNFESNCNSSLTTYFFMETIITFTRKQTLKDTPHPQAETGV